jgi:hypothetical protein
MTSIALFGPSGSGKTTVIKAFLWKMGRYYKDKNAHHEMELRISVANSTDGPFSAIEVPDTSPDGTKNLNIAKMTIGRVPRNGSDYRQVVSEAHHQILFADDQGGLFHYAAKNDISNIDQIEYGPDPVRTAWKILDTANNLVVLLDPTLIEGSRFEDAMPIATPDYGSSDTDTGSFMLRRRFKIGQYATMVSRLAWLKNRAKIDAKDGKNDYEVPRRIAVCITKSDIIGSFSESAAKPDELLGILFGDPMMVALNELYTHFGEANVKLFVISALGKDPKTGKQNFDRATSWLSNPNVWLPERVEEPFLWLLQESEKDVIRDGSNLPSFLRRPLIDSRLESYIPYMNLGSRNGG